MKQIIIVTNHKDRYQKDIPESSLYVTWCDFSVDALLAVRDRSNLIFLLMDHEKYDDLNNMALYLRDLCIEEEKILYIYGRINGDQFALCMPKERFVEADFKSAVKEVTNRLTSTSYSVHIQLGVYEIRDKDMDISLMCDRAYMACKSITKDGVCEIAWYSDDMLINALLEKEILSSFDFAIINRQFGIYLQPQVHPDGTVYGAEALARWIHPENGLIEPAVFINVLALTSSMTHLQYMEETPRQRHILKEFLLSASI